jgi:hypothetical protein
MRWERLDVTVEPRGAVNRVLGTGEQNGTSQAALELRSRAIAARNELLARVFPTKYQGLVPGGRSSAAGTPGFSR